MNKYQKMKEKVHNEAMDFQRSFAEDQEWSYDALYHAQMYFEEMGKRYGLLEEFRTNGII